jgi:CRP-like cAMP-binding protein
MYEDLKQFLSQFVPLSKEEFGFMEPKLFTRKLEKREYIIKAGETENFVYFLNEGLIHQFFFKGKEQITTDIIDKGTIINGAVSYLSKKPSHYYLQAMESTTLTGISREDLETLYKSDIKWQRLGRILITYYLIRQERDNVEAIQLPIRERFQQYAIQNPGIVGRVSQRRLASLLNIKPETLSRIKPSLDQP